jgi:oligopeptide/dipeptide ABC transporter ATP-binding protein
MYHGKIVEYGPKESIYRNALHPYTRLLIEASRQQLKDLKDLAIATQGCAFLPRCSLAFEACSEECLKSEVEPNHVVFCHRYT